MRILLDNKDGLGSLDYTGCVQCGAQAEIVRELNKLTLCKLAMVPGAAGLRSPATGAYLQVQDVAGNILFTGYVSTATTEHSAGVAGGGDVFAVTVQALSDEILLDTEMSVSNATLLGGSAAACWNLLSEISSSAELPLALSDSVQAPSRLTASPGARWSTLARLIGNGTRSAYSAISGELQVIPVGTRTHTVMTDDPGLKFAQSIDGNPLWLASDITVCGKDEPAAYVTEIFSGDGATLSFTLTEDPFEPVAAERTSIQDLFQGDQVNSRLWSVTDPGGYLSLTASGLTCSGGTGRDGSSTVASLQQIELGGLLTLEAGAVAISSGSAGLFLGLYTGGVSAANCFLGFQVTTTGGSISVSPLVDGSIAGTAFIPISGGLYTYRIRLYSPETERIRQTYFYEANGVTNMAGGDTVPSQGLVEFEVQNLISGIPGTPVILYAGAIAALPPAAVLGLLDSSDLQCGLRSVLCTQSMPSWVAVGQPGATAPQFIGASTAGGTCTLSTSGKLTFLAADVPSIGALILVSYRSRSASVARRNLTAQMAGSLGANSAWIGGVAQPTPFSSVDCDRAVQALLAMAASSATCLEGTYNTLVQEGSPDIWPGDLLSFCDSAGTLTASAIVREVTVKLQGSSPATLAYTVLFANDAAQELSIRTSSTVPKDTVIPQSPTSISTALLSLTALTIVGLSGSTITLNTGLTAPVNGGFEIRRREGTFGPGTDSDLVLRTSASTIAIPRSDAVEQFYVRMYDSAQPPNYSLHSAALLVNVPV